MAPKRSIIKKILLIVSLFCLLLLSAFGVFLVATGTVYIVPPWKITDPHAPDFDPMKFRFEDYMFEGHFFGNIDNYEKTCDVVKAIITPGMPQETVKNILVDSGGAYILRNDEFRKSYLNPVEIGWFIPLVVYSKNYQAQIIVVQYDNQKNTMEVKCIAVPGTMASGVYRHVRKERKN